MASELVTLQAIEGAGNLNPVQRTRLNELRSSSSAGNPFGIESATGAYLSGGARSSGVPFDANAFLTSQRAEGTALRARQSAEEEALFQTFQTKATAQPKLTDVYSSLLAEKGVPVLQKTSDDILNMIDSLNKDVTARTAGTFTNEAQRKRLYASELTPLTESLTPISRSLATAREDIGTKLSLTAGEQTKELEPYRMRIAATSDRFARETTGYTQDRQDTLTFLLQKIQRDQALSDNELLSARELAKSEREWEQTKDKLQIESENAIKLKLTKTPGAGTPQNPYLISTPSPVTPIGGGKTGQNMLKLLNSGSNLRFIT